MIACCSVRVNGNIYLECDENGTVLVSKSIEEALDRITSKYNEYHGRDYTWSCSATINYITFNRKYHEISQENFYSELISKEILTDNVHIFSIHNISGYMYGILCDGGGAQEWHDSGLTPELITEEGKELNAKNKEYIRACRSTIENIVKGTK